MVAQLSDFSLSNSMITWFENMHLWSDICAVLFFLTMFIEVYHILCYDCSQVVEYVSNTISCVMIFLAEKWGVEGRILDHFIQKTIQLIKLGE